MSNEKAVFTFEKVNETIITVVEALGGVREEVPQEEILYVPDEIQFYEWDGSITLEISDGLGLSKDPDEDAPFLCGIKKATDLTPIKCKLVPVKYEDVKVGDFVVMADGKFNDVSEYSMKHGDQKFCDYTTSFSINQDDFEEGYDLLKVVKA